MFLYKNRSKFVIILLLFLLTSPKQVYADTIENNRSFSDTSGHWGEEVILKWSGLEIISGYSDGSFLPDKYITKAELAVILNNISNFHSKSDMYFNDISPNDWYYDYIVKAISADVIVYRGSNIKPNEYVKRQDAIMAIGKTLNISTNATNKPFFKDSDEISTLALPYVNAFAEKGYIHGKGDGLFYPNEIVTRAEMVQIFDNSIKSIYNQSGTYIKTNTKSEDGVLVVNTRNVKIQDHNIEGDIVITEGGQDTIFRNSIISGKIDFIKGEELNINDNSIIGELNIINSNATVYINIDDLSIIRKLNIIGEDIRVIINGPVENAFISSKSTYLDISNGRVKTLEINKGCDVLTSANTIIENLILNADANIYGNGKIESSFVADTLVLTNVNKNTAELESTINNINSSKNENNRVKTSANNIKNTSTSSSSSESENESQNNGSKPNIYKVTFDGNGGKFQYRETEKQININENSFIDTEEIIEPTYNGYKFLGWGNKKNLNKPNFDFTVKVKSDTTIYAIWEKIPEVKYAVTYDANKGAFNDGSTSKEFLVKENTAVGQNNMPQDPYLEKHIFMGWSRSKYSPKIDFNKEDIISENIKLYAVWEMMAVDEYRVSFDTNGGVFEDGGNRKDAFVKENFKIGSNFLKEIPTFSGHTFLGWTTNINNKTPNFDKDYVITTDLKVYALWKPIQVKTYVITYNANSGKFTDDSVYKKIDIEENGYITEEYMPESPKLKSNKFLGWSLNKSAKKPDNIEDIKITKSTILFAIWEEIKPEVKPEPRKIVFNTNGGVFGDNSTAIEKIAENNKAMEKEEFPEEPVLENHKFKGWGLNKNTGTVDFNENYIITKDLEVYAVWEEVKPEPRKIVFNTNGGVFGDNSTAIEKIAENNKAMEKEEFPEEPVLENHKFKGWGLNKNTGTVDFNENYIITKDLEVYAVWEEVKPETRKVLFNTNGGAFGDNSTAIEKIAENNKSMEKEDFPEDPTLENHKFKGWGLNKNSGTVDFNENYIITKDLDVYAVWEEIKPEVKPETRKVLFNTNGGAFGDNSTAIEKIAENNKSMEKEEFPEDPTLENHKFKGWGLNKNSGTVDFNENYIISKDLDVYAVWEEIKPTTCKVTFNGNGGSFLIDTDKIDIITAVNTKFNEIEVQYIPVQPNSDFLGWSLDKNAINPDIKLDYSITQDINIYAVWGKKGTGTIADPYCIYTTKDFLAIGSDTGEYLGWKLNSSYKLSRDIDFAGESIKPIGSPANYFNGTFDGNNKMIKNIGFSKIIFNGDAYSGLFSYIGSSGIVKNLNISNININLHTENEPNYYFGIISGYNTGSIINCHIADGNKIGISSQNGVKAYIGVITGYNKGIVEGASVNMKITGDVFDSYIGGIAGYNAETIEDSFTNMDLEINKEGRDMYSGGISGFSKGNIKNVYSLGKTTVIGKGIKDFCGGIVGSNEGLIEKCYSKMDVIVNTESSYSYVGGIVAYNNRKTVSSSVVLSSVVSCDFGEYTALSNVNVKRVSAYKTSTGKLFNNYALSEMQVKKNNINQITNSLKTGEDGESISLADISKKDKYIEIGWDFSENGSWHWDEVKLIPTLKWQVK